LAAASLLAPAAAFLWLLGHPTADASLVIRYQHFYLVSAVSLLAFGLAILLAIAALQMAQYRALFLALGFMAMGGIYSVHGIDTPGILLGGPAAPYAGRVVGISAFLSLFIPALFFAASFTPITATFERRLPFSPAGWIIVVLSTAVGVYIAIAMAAATVALLLFAALRQAQAYLVTRLPMQGILVVAFVLLAQASVQMVLSTVWKLSWWEYHVVMLLGVGLAFWSLAMLRVKGQSLRTIVEATLELEIKVGTEIEHVETIRALAAAVEARDENTEGHNVRVAELAVMIGRELDLPNDTLRVLARSGLLHDVGKIGIPDAILSKPGPLTADEWTTIKLHPQKGHEILSRINRLYRESEIVIAHHERIDGSGYPRGLRGEEIPLEARIIAVADTYDVLVSNRPYRKARRPEQAIRILREESGTHLWPPAVEALLRSLAKGTDNDGHVEGRVA
jgi:HD-GYP domain-containing protein (c-di-GMP phosphodiesterase class II)